VNALQYEIRVLFQTHPVFYFAGLSKKLHLYVLSPDFKKINYSLFFKLKPIALWNNQ